VGVVFGGTSFVTLHHVLVVKRWVYILDEVANVRAIPTLMALNKQVRFGTIDVTTCLGFVFGTIATYRATVVPDVVLLLLKIAKSTT
jgi:hypothetical protein